MSEIMDKHVLKALSNDTRQEIIKMMTKRPFTASEISKKLGKHVTTVTEHLDILQKANLVKRKDSENKWVYYTLTEKGDKLFKPRYYSWIVTLSLSIIMLFAGVYNLMIGTVTKEFAQTAERLPLAGNATAAVTDTVAKTNINQIIGIILIIAAIIGFAYLIIKKK